MTILGVTASSFFKPNQIFDSIVSASGNGSSGTISFSNIPQTYKHLQIRWVAKGTQVTVPAGDNGMRFTINGSSTNYYSQFILTYRSDLSGISASYATNLLNMNYGAPNSRSDASTLGSGILDIFDYTSTKSKTWKSFAGSASASYGVNYSNGCALTGGIWNNSSAITSLDFTGSAIGAWATVTKIAIYGIKG